MAKIKRARIAPASVGLEGLALDRSRAMPLHRQLYLAIRALIARGLLKPATALPSTRALAQDLAVARNTVVAAYDQLASEGYLDTRQRSRPTVVGLAPAPREPRAADTAPSLSEGLSARGRLMLAQPRQRSFPGRIAFHPGTPDLRQFPFAEWRRLLARRLRQTGDDLFGYHHLAGYPPLREAIAAYLGASRGVRCGADQIVVTTGAQAGLDLLARLLLDPGDSVWMEEPGYLGAQSAFLAAGARLQPLAVDEAGWALDAPPEAPKLIYVTPSCHSPLGVTMRMEQRLKLLEIARARNAWVIEDDFDSEFRFVGRPIPAMQGADATGRTIYLGTFAKTLFPALRIGFAVLPGALGERANRALSVTGQNPPLVLQATLADFLERGLFARHLRRMRRLYGRRRTLFVEMAQHLCGGWILPQPGDAGIQTLWWLDPARQDRRLAETAERIGLTVAPLSRHYRHSRGRNGLILGYAALDEATMQASLGALKACFDRS